MEQWKQIKGFDNYYVSTLGNIRGSKGYIQKQLHKDGRYIVSLSIDGKKYTKKIHKLVCEAYIENVNNYPTVDHINRNYLDNRIENLRWADYTQQLINREYYNPLGSRNIRLTATGKYQVRIRRYGVVVFDKTLDTLDDAIVARDDFLTTSI